MNSLILYKDLIGFIYTYDIYIYIYIHTYIYIYISLEIIKGCVCNNVNVCGCFNNFLRLLQDFMWKFTMADNLLFYIEKALKFNVTFINYF